MIIPYSLQKKQNIQKISNRNVFCIEHQKDLQRFNAEMRTWNFIIDTDIPNLIQVADSTKKTEQVLFVADALESCSCLEYFQNKCGTCYHIEAVRRLKTEIGVSNQKLLINHLDTIAKYVSYNSELNEFISNIEMKEIPQWLLDYQNKILSIQDLVPIYENFNRKNIFAPSFYTAIKTIKDRKLKTFDFRIENLVKENKISLNPFVNIQLFDYQKESVQRMLTAKRCALILEMGLGKTLCAITCLYIIENSLREKEDTTCYSSLIVCPNSLKKQWEKEIKRFMPGAETLVINDGKSFQKWLSAQNPGFVIVNYEILQRYSDKLSEIQKQKTVILDEVQKIKNKETKAWKAIKKINSEYLFALSGTIVENSYNDFISIMEIINEAEVSPRWRFVSTYYDYEGERINSPKDLNKLKKKFRSYLIRPDALSSIKFPGILEEVHESEMSGLQKNVENANKVEAQRLLAIAKNRGLSYQEKIMLNAYLTKARMAANDIRLLDSSSKEQSGKLKKLEILLDKYILQNKEKVVIFSEWLEMLKLIEKDILLKNKEYKYVLFHGGIPAKKRSSFIDTFVNDPETKLFLSTDAGGVGVDGLQLVSKRIIHTEPPWNPARIDQRNGRLNRMLQKNIVNVDYLYSKNSIEDMVLFAGAQKRNMRKIIMEIGK